MAKNGRVHPNEKPVGLMTALIRKTIGVVCDPFMGSGTTGVACVRFGRKFIGIEKEPKYFEIAVKRIERELDATPLLDAIEQQAPGVEQNDLFADDSMELAS